MGDSLNKLIKVNSRGIKEDMPMKLFETSRSNDTGWIAYTSDRGGTFDIWLYRPADTFNYRLTQGLGEEFSVPYWSPDSRKIAFLGKGNIVYVLDRTTGSAAQIDQIEPYTLLDWSPDSRFLTYVKNGVIVIYDTITHSSRRILQQGARDAQWFPSGRELLFSASDSAGFSQLYRINDDGTNKRQLTQNTEGLHNNVRLSPDGRFVLFTSPGASISIITTIDLATGGTNTLEGGPLAKNYFPEWSPDSFLISYSATAFTQHRYYSLIQTDSRTGRQKRSRAVSDCFSTPVTWSPDGNRIAYLSGCSEMEQASQIWVVDLRNHVSFKIVEGGRINALQWSPRIVEDPYRYKIYTNLVYHVSFPYPADWRKVTEERYEGADGFFQISAISSEDRIEAVCHSEANHPLRPYGSRPRIVMSRILNQDACFIFPSEDQPAEMNNQAALIVKYARSVQIGETSYQYFILWADQKYIIPMARGLSFI
jgi:TolB protein